MKSIDNFPAVQKAFDCIKTNLTKGTWHQGERLPSMSHLAQMAGVSRVSVIKAIGLLKEEGLVNSLRRHRLKAGGPSAVHEDGGERLESWQRKRNLVEKEIVSGAFGVTGKLPRVKELLSRYGVCYRTMRKILHSLEVQGVVQPSGKGYVLPGTHSHSSRRRIVFITTAGHVLQQSALNKEHNRIVNLFENECMQVGLHLEIIEIDFYDSVKSRLAITRLTDSSQITGFILDLWWYATESYRRAYIDVLARITPYKKPVAILDQAGNFDLPIQFVSNPLVQVYTIERKRAGERMARYLLGLGHHSALYISILHDTDWSRDRFEGIRTQFTRAGYADTGVRLVTGSNTDMIFPCLLTAAGLDDDVVRKLIAVGHTPSQLAVLEKDWMDFKSKHTLPYPGYPRLNSTLIKNLSVLADLARQKVHERFFRDTITGALDAVGLEVFEMGHVPLFEKALSFHDATAWICANDAAAFVALAFLRERNIRVPDDISVAGFDNTPEDAFEQHLTSFDFNAMGFIKYMLNFILRPPKPRGPYRHSVIEVEGIIIERGTTGKAPR